jgi:uncharacterized RDD family membrane protein YckC
VKVTRRALTDPTAVVARRGGAWFIDGVLCALAGAVPALLLADAYELNRTSNGFDVERHGEDVALFLRDTVIVLRKIELGVTVGAFLGAVLILLVLLPGLRGWSPGYLAAELRLVRQDGDRAGIGRALVRTLAWVVDILPGIPLVAYASARATTHHQRVGDLLARSFVVDKRAEGRPIDERIEVDEPLAPVVQRDPTPTTVETARDEEEAVVDKWWLDDSEEEDAEEDDHEVGGHEEPAEPSPPAAADPPAAAPAPTAPPDGVPVDEPIWDRRNKRYVLWHSKAGRWLAHTDQGWTPFEGEDD